MAIEATAFARAGLIGNPSDGYYGKTISFVIRDFSAKVSLYESPELDIVPAVQDRSRYASMRDSFGDYQRQLFLMDHAGLPLKIVLEQLDILGEEVVPALRKEFAKNRPANVPDGPTHASLVAARSLSLSKGAAAELSGTEPSETQDNAHAGVAGGTK